MAPGEAGRRPNPSKQLRGRFAVPVMRPCPHCRAENSVKRGVCFRCGQSLSENDAVVLAPRREAPRDQPLRDERAPLRGGILWTRAASRFFRSWASLIARSMTVADSLDHLATHGPPGYRDACAQMAEETAEGGEVSAAMSHHPRLFLPWQIALVRSGEAAGALPEVVERIADDLEGEYRMRMDLLVKTWHFWVATIPAILLVLPIALALSSPMPQGGWSLPQLLHRLGFYFLTTTVPVSASLVALLVASRVAARAPRWRERLAALALRTPLLGAMLRQAALTRFFGSLSLLLRAGVPIAHAVETAADASGDEAMAARLRRTGEAVRSGRSLTEALEAADVATDDDMRILATGEQAGEVPDALGRVADWYDEAAQTSRRRYPLLIQLIGYLVLGLVAGAIVITIYRAYLSIAFSLFDGLHGF